MSPFDTSVFISKFVEEARDRLKALGAALLRLERAPGTPIRGEAVAEALRQAHSLKGSALMLGFSDISQVSHQLEDLFIEGGRNPSLLDGETFDVVFGAVDLLTTRVEQLARGVLDPVETGELCRKLTALAKTDRASSHDAVARGARFVKRRDGCRSTGAQRARQKPELRESLRVPVEKLDRLTHLAPEMVVQSLNAFERHAELRRLERLLSRLRDRVREARLMPASSDVDHGAQLGEYADALDAITRRMREFLVNFSDDRVRLSLITEELRQNVIELTMLPLASVFDAFPRAGARPGAHLRQGSRADDSRPRDRARQEDHRADCRAADSPDPQRGRSRHRNAGGARTQGEARRRSAGAVGRAAGESHPGHPSRRWPRHRSRRAAGSRGPPGHRLCE